VVAVYVLKKLHEGVLAGLIQVFTAVVNELIKRLNVLWTSLFTTSGIRKLKIQTNNLNEQTNTMYSIQTKDNNK